MMGTRQQLLRVDKAVLPPILAGTHVIPLSDCVKDLGAYLTDDLTWNRHVAAICSRVHGLLYRLRYKGGSLSSPSGYLATKLNCLCNTVVRFIFNLRRDAALGPFYARLEWLRSGARRNYFLGVSTYRILTTAKPSYLFDLFPVALLHNVIYMKMQEKRDLEKFTKFLALKAAQIIVQSRSGTKINTKCKPHSSGVDWFNLSIQDSLDVLTEARQVLCKELISSINPFCIEISLRTMENEVMVLETWSLGILFEQSDPTIKITYTVYNRMGMLLKSLLSVSRVTPAYKLSRSQGPDSFIICYRTYMGPPQIHSLGENYKQIKVGQLRTPIGMIHLSV
ncbi:autophagy-related protein 13 homolog, partial [Copidosoma floridanum]|uniref:autophagy-related protein 13 homolog n=1 Tax=Copidosoma floridanum TaxID=29053 RepID=UPI000C6F4DE5